MREKKRSSKLDRGIVTVFVKPSRSMDDAQNQYLYINPKLMSLIGFGRCQTRRQRLLRYYIIGFLFLYMTFLQLCQLATLDYDIQSILNVLQILIPTVCHASAYYNCILNFLSIQTVTSIIKEDFLTLKDDAEWMIVRKHAHQCKLFTLVCGFMYCIYACFIILPPVLHAIVSLIEGRPTSTAIEYFPIFSCLNYILAPEVYCYPIFVFHSIIFTIEIIVAIDCYSFILTVLQHVFTLLSIIEDKIRLPFINDHCDNDALEIPLDYSDWIIDIAKRLAKSRKMTITINTTCEKCYLFQMMLACLLVVIGVLCLFQIPILLNESKNKKDIFMFMIFFFGSIFMIYVNCYMGQRLLDYSVNVYRAMCLVPIHKISLQTQKLLLTTLILNAKPLGLSIGKIFVASHEFFISLFRLSLSIAMMLHSMENA